MNKAIKHNVTNWDIKDAKFPVVRLEGAITPPPPFPFRRKRVPQKFLSLGLHGPHTSSLCLDRIIDKGSNVVTMR